VHDDIFLGEWLIAGEFPFELSIDVPSVDEDEVCRFWKIYFQIASVDEGGIDVLFVFGGTDEGCGVARIEVIHEHSGSLRQTHGKCPRGNHPSHAQFYDRVAFLGEFAQGGEVFVYIAFKLALEVIIQFNEGHSYWIELHFFVYIVIKMGISVDESIKLVYGPIVSSYYLSIGKTIRMVKKTGSIYNVYVDIIIHTSKEDKDSGSLCACNRPQFVLEIDINNMVSSLTNYIYTKIKEDIGVEKCTDC